MPGVQPPHVHASVSRSASHTRHVFLLRLKRANLPLLIAFLSSLLMFLRALSGAGYTEPRLYAPPDTISPALALNQSHLATGDSGNAHAYVGFAEHWARFKEAVLACPDNTSDDTGPIDHMGDDSDVDGDDTSTDNGSAKPRTTRTRYGVGCLKERLSSAISLRKPSGPTVKKEDRAFGVSLDGIPSRRKAEALQKLKRT